MTEAMPFLQKHDITFLRPPTISRGALSVWYIRYGVMSASVKISPFSTRLISSRANATFCS